MVKKYIYFNTNKRKHDTSSFQKYFFKLMNNSAHGKTTENLRKRVKVRLIIDAKDYRKYVRKPIFVS